MRGCVFEHQRVPCPTKAGALGLQTLKQPVILAPRFVGVDVEGGGADQCARPRHHRIATAMNLRGEGGGFGTGAREEAFEIGALP